MYIHVFWNSKAINRVNHYVLFEKLIKQGILIYIVRILVFWHTTKKIYVRWMYIMSDCFSVTNGVHQGGILSPYLFWVYMDDLSKKLNNVNAECIIGAALIDHLMYADDLVLLAPSSMGLSMLLSACSDDGLEYDIKYNSTKSNVMIFCCKKLKYAKLCVK